MAERSPRPARDAPRASLSDRIADGIRDRVFAGDLRPGDRIGEMEIAHEYGASQAPVREAFAKLRQDGLIVSFPNRGTFVTEVSEDEARIAYDVRRLLEPYVMARVVDSASDDDLGVFRELLERMRDAARDVDHPAFVSADMRFHGEFYRLTGSPLLSALWDRIEGVVRKFTALTDRGIYSGAGLTEVVAMHEALLAGVEKRDAAALGREIERHIDTLWSQVDAGARER